MATSCKHLEEAGDPPPRTPEGCEECLALGEEWVHLRRCLSCGHIGCCDDSKNKHATKHFRKVKHPVIQSYSPGESWRWCFVDEIFTE
jgi:uncharacterized UBP type Zn finger protein